MFIFFQTDMAYFSSNNKSTSRESHHLVSPQIPHTHLSVLIIINNETQGEKKERKKKERIKE